MLVLGTDAKDQLIEIVRQFKIVYNPERFLVRCVFCNTEKFEELSPEAAMAADSLGSMWVAWMLFFKQQCNAICIPPRVFTQVPSFQMCSGCRRIFWRGPKFKNAEESLLEILRQWDCVCRRSFECDRVAFTFSFVDVEFFSQVTESNLASVFAWIDREDCLFADVVRDRVCANFQ